MRDVAVVGVVALRLRVSFCHVFANLCFSVELGALAMVGLGFGVDPDFSIATAGCRRGGCCSLGRRRRSGLGQSGHGCFSCGAAFVVLAIEAVEALAFAAGAAIWAKAVAAQNRPTLRAKTRS